MAPRRCEGWAGPTGLYFRAEPAESCLSTCLPVCLVQKEEPPFPLAGVGRKQQFSLEKEPVVWLPSLGCVSWTCSCGGLEQGENPQPSAVCTLDPNVGPGPACVQTAPTVKGRLPHCLPLPLGTFRPHPWGPGGGHYSLQFGASFKTSHDNCSKIGKSHASF